jgi:hypothetical protein
MQYNVCKTCGAKDGRAGNLMNYESMNCYDTRTTQDVVIHANLIRTEEEYKKTFNILNEEKQNLNEEKQNLIEEKDLFKIRWKTVVCHSGESCWCRCISPEKNVVYKDNEEVIIAPSGCLSKKVAEYLVDLHNSMLLK